MSLSSFFKENVSVVENIEYVVSDRFEDENGNSERWILRALSPSEEAEIKRMATSRKAVKYGKYEEYTDNNKYLNMLVASSIVYPNLKDSELQDSYGIKGADNLLQEMLTLGEYTNLAIKVQELNGLSPFEELVEEAKN